MGSSQKATGSARLADVLLSQPQVLILDEPTMVSIRTNEQDVLKQTRGAGRERTVILSTHICRRWRAFAGAW